MAEEIEKIKYIQHLRMVENPKGYHKGNSMENRIWPLFVAINWTFTPCKIKEAWIFWPQSNDKVYPLIQIGIKWKSKVIVS